MDKGGPKIPLVDFPSKDGGLYERNPNVVPGLKVGRGRMMHIPDYKEKHDQYIKRKCEENKCDLPIITPESEWIIQAGITG